MLTLFMFAFTPFSLANFCSSFRVRVVKAFAARPSSGTTAPLAVQ